MTDVDVTEVVSALDVYTGLPVDASVQTRLESAHRLVLASQALAAQALSARRDEIRAAVDESGPHLSRYRVARILGLSDEAIRKQVKQSAA